MAPSLDYDRVHIHDFPEIVEELATDQQPRILILGNSLLLWGANEHLIQSEFSATAGKPSSVTKITPVSTTIHDWRRLYDTYFTAHDTHPEICVIGFVGHHVPDGATLKLRRHARHFASAENLWSTMGDDLPGFEQRALAATAHLSALVGDQKTLSWGISHIPVAEYSQGTNAINNFLDAKEEADAENGAIPPPPKTYSRLGQFITTLRSHGVQVALVPMPQPEVWNLDPNIEKTAQKTGAIMIDARAIEGMTEEDFSDGYHLGGGTGGVKFSRWLGRELAAKVALP